MNQISRRTIPVLIALIFAAGCDSPADPKTIAAAYPPIEATANTAITSASPVLDDSAWKGTWEAANLPEGLKINPDTGVISGTPTTESTKADYSITLTGTGDSDGVNGTAAVSIAVTPLTAAYDAIEATVGTPITEVTPIPSDTGWTGTWAANLPDGLKIAPATGIISGTPTAVSDKTDYTVTLTGTGDSEGVDGSAVVSITIMPYAPLALTAVQVKITDGIKSDGTKKFPSHAMVFDIATTDTVKTTVPVEFLLVKEGLAAPATLEEFRKTAAITMTSPAKDSELVMAFKSALFPLEKTSLYLAHDSQGNYPLDEGTGYTLYAAQPESSDTTPQNLGDFTTGTHLAAVSYTGTGFAEDISTMETTGNLYMAKTQFIILHGLKTDDLPIAWSATGPPRGSDWILNGIQANSPFEFSVFAKTQQPKPGSLTVGIVPENDYFASLSEYPFDCTLTSGFAVSGVFTFKLID